MAANGLEALAVDSGVIGQDSALDPAGSYGRDYQGGNDRLCLRPLGRDSYQAGVEIRIGEEEYCHGGGEARRAGDLLIFTLAQGKCLITAHYEGDQIVMPGAVDAACASLCSARGSLAGVTFLRRGSGEGPARAATGKDGTALCRDRS